MVAFGCLCVGSIFFLREERQEVAHFGLFLFRLSELCGIGRVLLALVWLSVWEGSVFIVFVRFEGRRRPFRFISVGVLWFLLGSVLYGFVASRPAIYNILG